MGDVKVEFSDMNLGEKLIRKYRISPSEAQMVTKTGAAIHMAQLQSEIRNKPMTYSKGGLSQGIAMEPSGLTDHSTVVGFLNTAYYWRFVDEGHYQLYYGRKINNGNKYFAGYHFIEPAFRAAKDPAAIAMHAKLEQIWGSH